MFVFVFVSGFEYESFTGTNIKPLSYFDWKKTHHLPHIDMSQNADGKLQWVKNKKYSKTPCTMVEWFECLFKHVLKYLLSTKKHVSDVLLITDDDAADRKIQLRKVQILIYSNLRITVKFTSACLNLISDIGCNLKITLSLKVMSIIFLMRSISLSECRISWCWRVWIYSFGSCKD